MPEPSWKQDLLLREMRRCLPSADSEPPAAAPVREEGNYHAVMPWATWEAVLAANHAFQEANNRAAADLGKLSLQVELPRAPGIVLLIAAEFLVRRVL